LAKIPPEVMELVNASDATKVMGTVDRQGIPNVVPLGSIRAVSDDTIVFAEIFHIKTKENLLATKKATVLVVKDGKAYQIKGTFAGYTSSGPAFEAMSKAIMERSKLPTKAVGMIKVDSVYSCIPGENSRKLA
jgi:predicted pyridoxine 5'-phosphate oxidase superfamily flavin-nucleotide-binding protein